MKTTNLKLIAYALSALMLLQSCVVYHKAPVSANEAVVSQKKVMVKTNTDEILKFRYLIKVEDQIYGITKKTSPTAKRLFAKDNEDKMFDNMVGIILSQENIKEIRVENIALSTIIGVGILTIIIG